MQISTKDWLNYINKLSSLNDAAAKQMQQYVQQHGFGDRDALIDYAYGLVTKYGEGSAALSAQMYETIAEMSSKAVSPAVMAETASHNEIAKMVNGILKQSQNENVLINAVARKVKQAGADTTLQNALRDGAQFAWIPHGDTCAFCIALASRGWQNASKKAIRNGHAEHIHSNCDCTYAIRFDEKTNVAGYEPKKYLDAYNSATDSDDPKAKINAMRRAKYALNADKIRAQHRAAYEKRNVNLKTANMDPDEYARAKSLWYSVDEIDIPQSEKEHIFEELDNNLTAEEKSKAIVSRPIDDYYYRAVNLGHNQYKIYAKDAIDMPKDVVDEVLTEMFGNNWRDLLDE